jgi:multidrug efflux pump subunit AcrA (membrane-fusion protein)
MKKDHIFIALACAVSIAILGGLYWYTHSSAVAPTVPPEAVTQKIETIMVEEPVSTLPELNAISYKGRVLDSQYRDMVAPRDGVVTSLSVRVGDKVARGETLATLYHAQSEEVAAGLRIEAKKAEVDAEIARKAVEQLRAFSTTFNTKLRDGVTASQENITNVTNAFISDTVTNAPTTKSYATELQKTLEQDVRELTEKLTSKSAQAPIGSFNLYARHGVAAGNSQVFSTFASLLDSLTFRGDIVVAYEEAQKTYTAALAVLNGSTSTDTFPQTTIDTLRDKILIRIANLADRYSTINQALLDSVKVKYEAEVAKSNTNLDLQKSLLSAEKEIAQNGLDIQKLEAQASLYPKLYATGLGGVLYTTLTAPFAGVITDVPAVAGAFRAAGSSIVTIHGAQGVQSVRIEIDKQVEVRPGDRVYVYDPELPFQKIPGTVRGIGSAVTHLGMLVLEVSIPAQSPLFTNDTVRVRIPTHAHGVRIPLSAVVTKDEKSYVWKVIGGKLTQTKVDLGSIVDRDVKVFTGVRVGDVLAAAPLSTFIEGQDIESAVVPAAKPGASEDGHAHEH